MVTFLRKLIIFDQNCYWGICKKTVKLKFLLQIRKKHTKGDNWDSETFKILIYRIKTYLFWVYFEKKFLENLGLYHGFLKGYPGPKFFSNTKEKWYKTSTFYVFILSVSYLFLS